MNLQTWIRYDRREIRIQFWWRNLLESGPREDREKRGVDDIKMDLTGIGYEDVRLMEIIQNTVKLPCWTFMFRYQNLLDGIQLPCDNGMDSPDSVIGLYELYTNAICRQTAVFVWSKAEQQKRQQDRVITLHDTHSQCRIGSLHIVTLCLLWE